MNEEKYPEWVQKTLDCKDHLWENGAINPCVKCGESAVFPALAWYLECVVPITKQLKEEIESPH